MAYQTIQPPFTLKFSEMSKKELKDYFQWFLGVIPERINELANAVRATPGYEAWQPDQMPTSLHSLGAWFATQVETRRRTQDEITEIKSRSKFPISIPDEELTNRTFSLAFDVGIYLSLVFLIDDPDIRWEQAWGGKSSIDYGQPVLVGFCPVPFNPVQMLVTLAYGLVSKKKGGTGLRDLYEIWTNLAKKHRGQA
jgi:hypothetical protein